MIAVALAVLALAGAQDTSTTGTTPSPATLANATKFQLTYDGTRVNSCTITATSGYAQIDSYVCQAARTCGDQYTISDRRDACLASKREHLAAELTKALGAHK